MRHDAWYDLPFHVYLPIRRMMSHFFGGGIDKMINR